MLTFKFSPFPVLSTVRLHLRKLSEADTRDILYLRSNDEVNAFIVREKLVNEEGAHDFIQKINMDIRNNKCLYWGICMGEHARLIGTICLWNLSAEKASGEIGYELHPAFQKKGIMHEAVAAVLRYAFRTLGLETIEAFTHHENEASKLLLERSGFVHDPEHVDEGVPHNAIYIRTKEIR